MDCWEVITIITQVWTGYRFFYFCFKVGLNYIRKPYLCCRPKGKMPKRQPKETRSVHGSRVVTLASSSATEHHCFWIVLSHDAVSYVKMPKWQPLKWSWRSKTRRHIAESDFGRHHGKFIMNFQKKLKKNSKNVGKRQMRKRTSEGKRITGGTSQWLGPNPKKVIHNGPIWQWF